MRLPRKALWTGIDQTCVAVGSIVAAVSVARIVPAAEFGAFALVLLARVLLIDVGRAVIGQPLQIMVSSTEARSEAGAFAAVAGVLLGALFVVGGVFGLFGGLAGPYLVALGVSTPFLLLHDTAIHDRFTSGEYRSAATLDAAVLILQLVGIGLVTTWDQPAWALFASWSLAIALVTLTDSVTSPALSWPSLHQAMAWIRRARPLWPGLVADTGLVQAQRQLSAWLMLAIGSLNAVAGYRGAQTSFRPLGVATSGVRLLTLPTLARSAGETHGGPNARRVAIERSLVLVGVAGLGVATLLALPDGVGRSLLGASWEATRDFVVPVGIAQAAQAGAVGAQLLLTSRGRTGELARVRSRTLVFHLSGLMAGGAIAGPIGAASGLAVTNLIVLPIWWKTAAHTGTTAAGAVASPPPYRTTEGTHS